MDRIRRVCVLARMARRQVLLVAGVAAGSLMLSDRSDAQPATVAAQPLVMASSRTCDGLRELMIDTAVHQTVLGYNPNLANRQQFRSQHPIQRSIVIDKFILSLSNLGIEIHALADMDVKAALSRTKMQKKTALAR
jgi:hypothetical protein